MAVLLFYFCKVKQLLPITRNPIFMQLFRLATLMLLVVLVACKKNRPEGEQLDFNVMVQDQVTFTVNPSGKAPLTALLEFKAEEPSIVEVTVEGDAPLTRTSEQYGFQQSMPVIGLYQGTNTVTVKIIDDLGNYGSQSFTVMADSLPDFVPVPTMVTANAPMIAAGWNLCEVAIGVGGAFKSYPMVIDHNGDIRWALDCFDYPDLLFPWRLLDNGNLLSGVFESLYEFDWLGNEVRSIPIPGYISHHEIQEMPNGNILVAVDKIGLATVEDHIIEITPSGAIVQEWDLREVLDVDRFDLVQDSVDWFHMNAIYYSESDDCLIISGKNQGVVKVTRDNQLVWILAPHKGWGKAGLDGNGLETSDYLLTAIDGSGTPYAQDVQDGIVTHPDFDWTWGQHAPMLLDNGHLFVYDNGAGRMFDNNTFTYSRAVEYSIDEANRTIRQTWQYGKERGMELFSLIISDVDVLSNDNRLMTSGIMFDPNQPYARVVEVTYPDKAVASELNLNFKNQLGAGTFAWGEFDICYRAERVDFSDL